MEPFDLLGPLPTGTTLLEASAGTGKTYAVAALVTRYVAEGRATLDQMLVITFGRAASQELRERVREQLVAADRALADPTADPGDDEVVGLLTRGSAAEVAERRRRIRDALADFDGATIATTHQFCQLVLRSLGVAGDTDTGAELVEDLDDLVVEVVDDVYLRDFGHLSAEPPFKRPEALALARAVVNDPQARIAPDDPEPGSLAEARVRFACTVRDEVERRKRRLGLLSYDDLLSRLADALEPDRSPARERMRQRWSVVLVDEFQDTDPVQWRVLDRAFSGHATMVLIGDPKQAIYAFRGGDVFSYLEAAERAATRRTLATNWRSDGPLVDSLQRLFCGAELGDPRIAVHPVEAHHAKSRLAGAPDPDPVRLRALRRDDFSLTRSGTIPIDAVRRHVARDLAGDVARLLASDATFDGRPVRAGDVAVLIYSLKHAAQFQAELLERGIPSVVSGGSSVLLTEAAQEWLTLLEALEQPHRSGRVRAVALTSFVGISAEELDRGGDDVTDEVAERVRRWLDLVRARGIAAVHEAVVADGLAERVLSRPDGERLLTDLDHLGQVLHDVAHREHLGLPGLLEWLRQERRAATEVRERTRRLDTDAHAVQFTTIHTSKGLQYPVVYLPLLFDKWMPTESIPLHHDEQGRRTLDVSGSKSGAGQRRAREELCGEELRLTYVALTRAQSQVVTWWAPSWDAGNSGLTRMLFGREPGEAAVPHRVPDLPSEQQALAALERWQEHGALHLESSAVRAAEAPLPAPTPPRLAVRTFDRGVDTQWRRTSYSGLIRVEEQSSAAGVASEPEVEGTVDEETTVEVTVGQPAAPDVEDVPSPMEHLPAGATFGSLVHAVLEHADPQASDLAAELTRCVHEQRRWWAVDAATEEIVAGLLPMQHSSLGSLADGLTLAEIPMRDRLCELDFEFPLVGGERFGGSDVPLAAVAGLLRTHLATDDPMRAYAERLENPSLGDQLLRGYLSGSIDVVLRVGASPADRRYVVVDYKTNRLGTPGEPLTALDYTPEATTRAMLHSHYPLQALLYSVVLHRYLRWRLGEAYEPEHHLGGILYLYVRGMCGPQTPVVDGEPCGVFSWRPPAALVVALSELMDGRIEVAS